MSGFDLQGLFAGLGQGVMSPMGMAGIGLLSGGGIEGAAQGVQAATGNLQAQELQRRMGIERDRDAAWKQQFANGASPSWASGLPPSLVQTAALAGPDQGTQLLGQGILHKGDLDAQLKQAKAMADLSFQNQLRLLRSEQAIKLGNYQQFINGGAPPAPNAPPQAAPAPAPQAPAPAAPAAPPPGYAMNLGSGMGGPPPQQPAPQPSFPTGGPMDPRRVAAGVASGLIPPEAGKMMIDGDEQSKVASRAQVARSLGMDPNAPDTKQYLLTGQIPKQEKNYPAILKADESVTNIDNSLDTVDNALENNKKAYGPALFPETRAMVGGWFGSEGAKATQEYQTEAKMLSQEIAKSLGGARPTAFEQQLQSKLQGGLTQPIDVRAKILGDVKAHLQRRRELAARQAEELRNGTYYRPTGEAPQSRVLNWHPETGLTEAK